MQTGEVLAGSFELLYPAYALIYRELLPALQLSYHQEFLNKLFSSVLKSERGVDEQLIAKTAVHPNKLSLCYALMCYCFV